MDIESEELNYAVAKGIKGESKIKILKKLKDKIKKVLKKNRKMKKKMKKRKIKIILISIKIIYNILGLKKNLY